MAKMKATCVRRTQKDEQLTHTFYRVSGGKGLQAQKLGQKTYYRDVIASTYVDVDGRAETLLFAATKTGKMKRTSKRHLITLWGGEVNTTSASKVLKNAGVGEVTSCPGGSSHYDGRKRKRRRRR